MNEKLKYVGYDNLLFYIFTLAASVNHCWGTQPSRVNRRVGGGWGTPMPRDYFLVVPTYPKVDKYYNKNFITYIFNIFIKLSFIRAAN
jgi:hypothetical protein